MHALKTLFCSFLVLYGGQVFSQGTVSGREKGVLYNGVCWAKSNVDKPGTFAATPLSYGMLYQWNSKKGWLPTESVFDSNNQTSMTSHWETANNPCPTGWRPPTIEEAKTLKHCKGCYRHDNNREGYTYYWSDHTPDTLWIPYTSIHTLVPKNGYWSSSGSTDDASKAWMFFPDPSSWPIKSFLAPHDYAFYIRCVTEQHDTVIDVSETICTKDLPYEWGDTLFDIGTVSGTYRFQQNNCAFTNTINLHLTVQSESEKPCPGVLINGVCWAEYNVDEPGRFANPGSAYGMLYQWNRREGWPAMIPDSVSGWDSTLEPGDTWEPVNDPCPIGWRMPTVEELKSLFDETKVNRIETGWDRVLATRYTDIATGNMVFFPHANYRDEHGVTCNILRKEYWANSHHWALWDDHIFRQQPYAYGFSVRCVANENACDITLTASETICKEELPYTWHDTTFKEGTVSGEYCIRRTNQVSGCDSIFYLYLTVDTTCGRPCKEWGVLINSVCWAESNVDEPGTFADTPEAFGLLYQWNKRKGYSLKGNIDVYDWYDGINENPYWEAVNNPCPADWHIPNVGDIYTLLDDLKVTREWTQQNGVSGVKFTDKFNGNAIFFPGAGSLHIWDIIEGGTDGSGNYWSTTKEYSNRAVYVFELFEKSILGQRILPLPLNVGNNAYSVRCVAGRDTTGCSPIVTDTSEIVCVKDFPYTWGDTIFDVGTESGVYRFQYISATTGCDSIVNLHLTIQHPFDTTFYDTVCQGSTYNNHGFSYFDVQEDKVDSLLLPSPSGCDSTFYLYLKVNPVYETPLYDTVCRGKDYSEHGFNLPNVQTDEFHSLTVPSRAGCDSVLSLHLTVLPVYDTLLYDSICPTARYDRHSFQLTGVTKDTVSHLSLQTVRGCDSLITLNLHVYPAYFFPATENICQGDSIPFQGKWVSEAKIYYDSLKTIHGCDSIYLLDLTVLPTYDTLLFDVLCEGTPYTGYGFNVPEPGEHRRRLQTKAGCDSLVTLVLTEEKRIEGTIGLSLEDCTAHGYTFFFEPEVSQASWEWDMGDGSTLRAEEGEGYHTYADSGDYRIRLRIETYNGCENRFTHVQHVPPYLADVPILADRTVIDEEEPTVRFRAEALPGMVCRWDFGDGTTGEGESVSHTYDATTVRFYDVGLQVFNADSCLTESRMRIEVLFLPKDINTFSPNGDGINDVFMQGFRIEIINRNGVRVFTGENGWDGSYQGKPATEDTYFYKLYYRTASGERMKTGFVTLIR